MNSDQKQKILVVDDEAAIADNITYALTTEGFSPVWADTAHKALDELAHEQFDLIVLDIGLPDLNGFELCKQIRKESSIPIIFLTARNEEIDRVVGLEIGADDYVVKPFSPRELTARIKAILRRTTTMPSINNEPPDECFDNDDRLFVIDEPTKTITFSQKPLNLSLYEYKILKILVQSPGRVYSRSELMDLAWDEPGFSTERTVDAHIKAIRAKLRASDPALDPIETRRGFGYLLREGL
ncbi:MAG: two-component system response regulator CreB [Chitinivibrionales bacterium]|nr:two-component system response regulator CreB [Chitinivibrionales bacterium]